jgi:homogentisate phytyltransferase/homogentisate geranylgeranyltransferase
MFWICVGLLGAAYAGAIGMGFTCSKLWSKAVTVISHSALAGILWHKATRVDFGKKASIVGFYMFVWKVGVHSLGSLDLYRS